MQNDDPAPKVFIVSDPETPVSKPSVRPHHPSDQDHDPIGRFVAQYGKKNRLIISLSVIGLVLFLSVAFIFPFKDKLFEVLYPKPKSQAAVCSGNSQVSAEQSGFVYTGGDLSQAIKMLGTPLYYSYDVNSGPQKQIYIIGSSIYNLADPLGLQLLMDNNLSNTDFKGLWGQDPTGWNMLTSGRSGGATIDTVVDNTVNSGTSIKISNHKSPSGTQITQVFKKAVSEGQIIVFGAWVKADDPSSIKIVLQNNQPPSQEFGSIVNQIEPNKWTFAVGFAKVPQGVSSFQLVLRVNGQEKTSWFSGPVAAVIDPTANNQTLAQMVLQRCGSAWFIDDEPGWSQSLTPPFIKPLTPEIYALVYNQYYSQIKSIDPSAIVMPGGLAGAPNAFDSASGYSPKTFLDSWRTAYKGFFNSEPPIDAFNIHYLAASSTEWSGSKDLTDYLTKVRSYMDQIPEWKGKPIWIGKLGVADKAPNGGIDFMQAAVDFLKSNKLNITKWFWFDTCGYNGQLASLFNSNNKICSWPMQLTALGRTYLSLVAIPTPTQSGTTPIPAQLTPTAIPSLASQPTSTPSAVATPTPTPVPTAIPTPNVTKESTSSSNTP